MFVLFFNLMQKIDTILMILMTILIRIKHDIRFNLVLNTNLVILNYVMSRARKKLNNIMKTAS